MGEIESKFNSRFEYLNITLPAEGIDSRSPGKIIQAGWAIWYLFGSDEKREYLDYYASHRMTNDSHVRIYSDGTTEYLSAIETMRQMSENPEEHKRLDEELTAENRRIAKMLEEKGFGIAGDESRGVLTNRVLRLGRLDE